MYLILDTETTALFNKSLSPDDPSQARICQIACLLLDKDFKERAKFYSLIKSTGWTISPGAQAANGLTVEECNNYGINIQQALNIFSGLVDCSDYIIGHNIDFDMQMITNELSLLGMPAFGYVLPRLCTMKEMTNICKLPGKYGKFKWPKLTEAYMHCFGESFKGAHDSLADVKACGEILKWMIDNKHIILTQPSVV